MQIHAHLIIASNLTESSLPEVYKTQSTDVQHFLFEKFAIDHARQLKSAVLLRPVEDEKRVVVVMCSEMSVEAQNALLKVFEEPPQDVVLYLLVPSESVIIPTLRSRLILSAASVEQSTESLASDFLQLSVAERLAAIASKAKAKDSAWMVSLATDVTMAVEQNIGKFSAEEVSAALMVSSAIKIRGGSKKMLLEHLALSLPVQS